MFSLLTYGRESIILGKFFQDLPFNAGKHFEICCIWKKNLVVVRVSVISLLRLATFSKFSWLKNYTFYELKLCNNTHIFMKMKVSFKK